MLANDQAYNRWAATYDKVDNITRDLEKKVARNLLGNMRYERVLELGCGTGKNTVWLSECSSNLVGIDFSEKMLEKALQKVDGSHVQLLKRDLLESWKLGLECFDLITSSLVLEHIENLDHIFNEGEKHLAQGGLFYMCELHPFKQYQGSKAHFIDGEVTRELKCFTHHISDYTNAAKRHHLNLIQIDEWFEDALREGVPRLLSIVFQK